jgi:hypothetical protein
MNCDLLEHKQLLICASGITSKVTDTGVIWPCCARDLMAVMYRDTAVLPPYI